MSWVFRIAILTLIVALPLVALGCEAKGTAQVRGQVVEVVGRNFSELETLRIRDEEGREFIFETEGFVGFTPSHVKEHQFLGQSLLITYVEKGDRLIAVSLED